MESFERKLYMYVLCKIGKLEFGFSNSNYTLAYLLLTIVKVMAQLAENLTL